MEIVPESLALGQQMGKTVKTDNRKNRQRNKKPLEFNNEKKISKLSKQIGHRDSQQPKDEKNQTDLRASEQSSLAITVIDKYLCK